MPKDNRIIKRAPRVGTRLVKDEDELAALLTPEEGKRLKDAGAITGDWEFTGSPVDDVALGETPAESESGDLELIKEELVERTGEVVKLTLERDQALEANRTLKGENTTLKSKATKAENDLKDSKAALDALKVEFDAYKKANPVATVNV